MSNVIEKIELGPDLNCIYNLSDSNISTDDITEKSV